MIEILVHSIILVPLMLVTMVILLFLCLLYENIVSYFRIRYISKHKDKIVVETEVTTLTFSGYKRIIYWFTVPARRKDEYYRWCLQEDGTPGNTIALCKRCDITKDMEHLPLWYKIETIDYWFRIGRSYADMKKVKKKLQDVSDEHFVMHKMSDN